MKFKNTEMQTIVPTKVVGPICIKNSDSIENVYVPMATYESPLWYSTKRGALVSMKCSGISVFVHDDGMSRSVIFVAEDLYDALSCKGWIDNNRSLMSDCIKSTGHHVSLNDYSTEIVGNLVYLRILVFTGNASGHNTATKAADAVIKLVQQNCNVKYGSISGNICADKKNSNINGILGRGKRCFADIVIPANICSTVLKTTPQKIVELNVRKNLLGSILAGSVRSANAHYANVLLAIFLATGQDVANIVEGSQGVTFAELRETELYFSVNIPNIIVGTIGNGKEFDFVQHNLSVMKCDAKDPNSSKRLATIITAAVLCAELSLLAAQTNQGELMQAHLHLERKRLT
ncbi:MAG: hydroxymethylglutaryl-CoA reductase [Alphaproteobacteria bacterium]|nr:hydroxymethylglutaryl-CoA reductase [Alphaproteobacteria bacterium]